jgi:DNA mismatch repair protein MutS
MRFEADKQTLKDLQIFRSESSAHSLFSLFQGIRTVGARGRLEEMLLFPFADAEPIKERSQALRFFQTQGLKFIMDRGAMELIEHYMKLSKEALPPGFFTKWDSLRARLKPNADDYLVQNGIRLLKEVLGKLEGFISTMVRLSDLPQWLDRENKKALELIRLVPAWGLYSQHYFFRLAYQRQTREVLDLIYDYEIFSVVAAVSARQNWTYPQLLDQDSPRICAHGLRHPLVAECLPNNLEMPGPKGIYFLTGANMAGKSTWLKAVGLAVYMAHLGFPVAAREMEFTLLHGLISTINLSDQLDRGLSHFYAEVLRVKQVAEKLSTQRKMLVIFDELFKGTNVKDALDASASVIQAFSGVRDSLFMISTHILEVADLVQADCYCFQTRLESGVPVYDYVLREGVSADRLGLIILKNSGVLELIGEAAQHHMQPFAPLVQPGEASTDPII